MAKIPGISRKEEELHLYEVLDIAESNLKRTQGDVKALAEELHQMLEDFDEADKEAQALWNNTDARFKDVNRELNRAAQARRKPYFGRIDFTDKQIGKQECYYIGRSVIARDPAHPEVIDWRAPIAGVYYDSALGDVSYSVKGEGRFDINLSRKRTYEIKDDVLQDFYDSDVVANDELLTKYLSQNKRAVLGEIIATIQQEQNEAIRKKPQHNMIIQGAAGSGKTTVAMHRISYILYNYELEFAPEDFYIIGSNQVLLNYITGVLPELNVYGVSQMTMEQLFVRLLYEDWDKHKHSIKPVIKGVTPPVKGTLSWFQDLEKYIDSYEDTLFPKGDVVIPKNKKILLSGAQVEKIKREFRHLSRYEKIQKLTEHVIAKLENELSGRYYSYTSEEKKRLFNYFTGYFGRPDWKGSIYDLYEEFLVQQNAKQALQDSSFDKIPLPGNAFDVYDLAALAYIYKRIKETQIIREAGHVVIDEAQDFGMMIYASLKYCMTKCTYTIMGDVAQNISMDYGLNDWKELQELMLPGEFDYFGLLQKSYRNTVEIADFATNILHHGSFQVYPIQPIIRHGDPVLVESCEEESSMVRRAAQIIKSWQAEGKETIAVICADEKEAEQVTKLISPYITLCETDLTRMEFQNGVMVLPLALTKGLEFDAVLLYNANDQQYPAADAYVKRLYVAATRALHHLAVLYQGTVTPLIGTTVSEEKKKASVVEVKKPVRVSVPEETEETKAEKYAREALEGAKEMAERERFGPKRIQVLKPAKQEPEDILSAQSTGGVAGYKRVKISGDHTTVPTYLERRKQELATPKKSVTYGEFGEMPDNSQLYPAGHSKIDCSVRMCMKGMFYYEVVSSYGTLRIAPLDQDLIRISFAKAPTAFTPVSKQIPKGNTKHKYRETREALEILTQKVLVKVDKKTGAVSFRTTDGKVLLEERAKEPRQITEMRAWMFFNWGKNESFVAKAPEGSRPVPLGATAKYISFGPNSEVMPAIASDKGYEILLPEGSKALYCNISMYGNYLSLEDTNLVDYYVKIK